MRRWVGSLLLVVNGLAPLTSPSRAEAQPPRDEVYRADQLTAEQFKALPPTAIIEFPAKAAERMTKQEILDREDRERKKRAEQQAAAQAKIEAAREEFARKQKAQVEASNAAWGPVLERIIKSFSRGRVAERREEIREKALTLEQRAQKASSEERKEIERQAQDLLFELLKLDLKR